MKKLAAVVLGLTLLFSTIVYADTTADIYRLYGIDDPPQVEEEEFHLEELLDSLFNTQSKLDSYKMLSTAGSIYELQYMKLLQSLDINIYALELELEKASLEIEKTKSGSVDDILRADVVYRTINKKYEEAILERVITTDQLGLVKYEDPNQQLYQEQADTLTTQVYQQEKVVAIAKSYSEIGEVGGNKYPMNASTYVTSPFGWRLDPLGQVNMEYHSGLDFRAGMGTEILSMFDGFVETVKETNSGGLTVVINHGNGVRTLYLHLSKFKVEVGQKVKQYQVIALSGNTGYRTTGPHLHFGLAVGGNAYDASRLFK